jgi:hypothetical protein
VFPFVGWGGSALDGAGGEAADHLALEDQSDHDRRDRRDEAAGRDETEVRRVPTGELGDRDGQRLVFGLRQLLLR